MDIIRTVTAVDEDRAVSLVVLAFSSDPIARWANPDPHQFLVNFPPFVRGLSGRAFEHETAYADSDYRGAALWLPPEVHPDEEALDQLIRRSMAEPVLSEALKIFEEMASYHPKELHWYLPMIGVDPVHQGKGVGAALLQHTLAPCDQDGVVAYLESTNPTNIPLYERHGFEVLGEIQVGSAPPMFPMARVPR